MRLDCPELRLRSVLGRLSWGKRYTGDAGSGLRGGQEANLTNMGNEATVSTLPCVPQSAWFTGSLDHLICQCQEVQGYRDPEGLGGLEIDQELKLGGLLHGEVGGLGALQDLPHEGASAAPHHQHASGQRRERRPRSAADSGPVGSGE
jgi:hypothetical protein